MDDDHTCPTCGHHEAQCSGSGPCADDLEINMTTRQFSNEIHRRMDHRGDILLQFTSFDSITVEWRIGNKTHKYGIHDAIVNMKTAANIADYFHKKFDLENRS